MSATDTTTVDQAAQENERLRGELDAENERLRKALDASRTGTASAQGLSDEHVRRLEHPHEFGDRLRDAVARVGGHAHQLPTDELLERSASDEPTTADEPAKVGVFGSSVGLSRPAPEPAADESYPQGS